MQYLKNAYNFKTNVIFNKWDKFENKQTLQNIMYQVFTNSNIFDNFISLKH